jgi:hypothetical protein
MEGHGADGEFSSSPGEVVICQSCSPADPPDYVTEDDVRTGIMQTSEGSLYLSTAATAKEGGGLDLNCAAQTVSDCDMACKALFGLALAVSDVSESWVTNRPIRQGGFNFGLGKATGVVQNNGHPGSGGTASWGGASLAADALNAMAKL